MLLTYVDESYDRQTYWIAALMCTDECVVKLTEALDNVVAWAADSYGVRPTAELHGHALFHGQEDWLAMAPMIRARIGVYHKALEAIASSAPAICIRGVDIPALNRRYDTPDHPHSVVLQHLLETIDERAEQLDERVLIIADDIDAPNDHRRNLQRLQRHSTPGYNSRKLTRIVDTMHFAPSSASRLLQAVDLVAYLHYRIESNRDTDDRAIKANAALWARMGDLVFHSRRWDP